MKKNSGAFLPIIIIVTIIWIIITWLYIGLNIYDLSEVKEVGYKILTFREKFIELFLILGVFALGFCLGSFYCKGDNENGNNDLYGFVPRKPHGDNLQVVEGIGPKIDNLLREDGINTFKELKDASEDRIKKVLNKGGKHFALANPKTWSEQADLAYNQKWKELKEYQDFLVGGV